MTQPRWDDDARKRLEALAGQSAAFAAQLKCEPPWTDRNGVFNESHRQGLIRAETQATADVRAALAELDRVTQERNELLAAAREVIRSNDDYPLPWKNDALKAQTDALNQIDGVVQKIDAAQAARDLEIRNPPGHEVCPLCGKEPVSTSLGLQPCESGEPS